MNMSQTPARALIVNSIRKRLQNKFIPNNNKIEKRSRILSFINFVCRLFYKHTMSKAHPPELKKYMDKKVRNQRLYNILNILTRYFFIF